MIFVRSVGWKSKVIVLQFSQKRSVVSFLFTETNVQGSCDNLAELSALGYHVRFSKYCLFVFLLKGLICMFSRVKQKLKFISDRDCEIASTR